MRPALLAIMLACLCGCTSLVRHSGDSFEAASVTPGRFQADDQACSGQARSYVSYDLRGMEGTGYARNRAYNAVYDRCMHARGYSARPYVENLLPGGG